MNILLERTAGALARLRAWLRSLISQTAGPSADIPAFPKLHREPEPEPEPPMERLVQTLAKPPAKARRSATQTTPDAATLAELLDRLDDTFISYQLPSLRESWLPKADIRALYKLGAHIAYGRCYEPSAAYQPLAMKHMDLLPSVCSALFCSSGMEQSANETARKSGREGKYYYPRLIFAIKADTLPAGVERMAGIPFRFGYAVQVHNDLPAGSDHSAEDGLFWFWCWIVVKPSGDVIIPRQLEQARHKIAHKNRQGGRGRNSFYSSQVWKRAAIVSGDEEKTDEERETSVRLMFRNLLTWWCSREQRWSVGIRKAGRRATFAIEPAHTAAFFADRERSITVDGKNKRIVHFVREHVRVDGARVRAHVRGLRSFVWRGFDCHVVAPKLSGALFTNCPVLPRDVPLEEAEANPAEYLDIEQFADLLASNEDAWGGRPGRDSFTERNAATETP